jgi:hypothetical protein
MVTAMLLNTRCFATTPINVGDGWHTFLCSESSGAFDLLGPFTFTSATQTVFKVADWGYDYERYNVYDYANQLGSTSVPARRGANIDNPDSAFVSTLWSHGTLAVEAGSHEIYIQISTTGPGDSSGFARGSVRVDLPGNQFVPVPVQFSVASNFNVGVHPVSIAVADFNRDGNLDVITANDATDNLTVMLGDGNGGFSLKTNYTIGTVPQGVATGDFGGDNIPDVVATRAYGNAAIFLRGLGDGSFASPTYQNFNATAAGGAVVVGDFNNDNKLDFAAAMDVGFTTILGAGNGTFSNAIPSFMSSDRTIATGDFNGDGKLDMAVSYSSGKYVSIVLGNGDGTFGTATNFSVPSSISTEVSGVLATADLDRDGKSDLVVSEQTGTNSITVFRGTGSGSLAVKTNYALGFGYGAVAIGDLNGDNIPDLAIGSGNNVHVLLGNGDATFGPRVNFPVGDSVYALAIADFNKDGWPDIVSANAHGTISVLLNQTFPPLHISPVGNQIALAWPTYAFGFELETTTNSTATDSWSIVGSSPTVVGAQNLLTNSPDDNVRFYRLRR